MQTGRCPGRRAPCDAYPLSKPEEMRDEMRDQASGTFIELMLKPAST
jgi:hypothetical protein